MNSKNFFTGLGVGMVAGSALGMMVSPRSRRPSGKSMVVRCLRNMSEMIDDVSEVLK